MKRLNIAMLGDQGQAQEQVAIDENNEALVTDQDAMQIQQQSAAIDEVQGVVEETQDASDSISQTAEKIEQMPEVSQEVVQIAQEQINYFTKRTGMSMSGVTSAMESYTDGNVDKKKVLVEQLNLAAEGLEKGISIAQEGIIDRIKNKFSLMFSSAKKLRKELDQVSGEYDKNGAKTDIIKDPAFARVLNPKEEQVIKPEVVLSLTKDILKVSNDKVIVKSIVDLTRLIEQVTLSLTKSTFIAKDGQLEKLEKMEQEIMGVYNEIKDALNIDNKKSAADAEPLDASSKDKIKTVILELLDVADFERVEDDLSEAVWGLFTVFQDQKEIRLLGAVAADMRAASRIENISHSTYRAIDKIMTLRYEVAHACVKYIKASTNK